MKVVAVQTPIDKVARPNWPITRRTVFLVVITALISFTLSWVVKDELEKNGGIRKRAARWAQVHGFKALTEEQSYLDVLKIPYYMLTPDNLPELVVDIKFKNFQKLQEKRQQALKRGVLVTGKDDFVAANIRHEGLTTKVKLRLKGDQLGHLKGKKWSFRVKVKGKDQLYGMRVFSIQSPGQRGFQGAPLFYSTLIRYGVLAPRYKLVNLVVNGSNLGVMSLEEHFSKEMLESSGRKESVIIRFDESLVWDAVDKSGRRGTGLGGHFDNYHIAPIDGYGTKRISSSESLSNNYKVAVGLLRAFESGKLAPSEVFDAELMGRYIAVSELWGSWHSFSWRNLRYYFNPFTAKLEPIGNDPDVHYRSPPGVDRAARGEPITSVMRAALLDDPEIYGEFKRAVQLISDDMHKGNLMADLEQIEQHYLPGLRNEFFLLKPFDQSELQQRIALLEKYSKEDLDELYQIKLSYPELLQAYVINDSEGSYVELANITPSLVEVLSINWVSKNGKSENLDVKFADNVQFPLVLPPTPGLAQTAYKKIYFDNMLKANKNYQLEVSAKISGAQKIVMKKAQPYYNVVQSSPIPRSSVQQQVAKHNQYMTADTSAGTMTIKPGVWTVDESIVVPKGFKLEIGSATTLRFADNTGIISQGGLSFKGSKNDVIKLEGINTNGWYGVAVISATQRSTLSHVVITGTHGVNIPEWSLTGGVTFYKSDVTINDSNFEESRGEDALNIVHSNFTLDNVSIRNTASDAFDADFSTGSVLGGLYQDIGLAGGGDAIDISGSKISVENTRFKNINDKAISVGEGSQLIASGLDINGTGTGAASKDASSLELKSSKIFNARVAGLMAYIKKPEYGPGRIIASSIEFGDGFDKTRVQKGSYISIDDNEVETVDIDVDDMYRTVMKKGLN